MVEGGRLLRRRAAGRRGVVVGHQTRLGQVGLSRPKQAATPTGVHRVVDAQGNGWSGATRTTRCRASSCCARARSRCRRSSDVEAKIEELNDDAGPAAARRDRSSPTTTAPS